MFGAMEDITERKQTQEELRVLSARHEAILAEVPDIIAEVDANKVYTWANQAGLEFFGPDVLGKEAAFYFEGEQDTYKIVQPLFNGNPHVFYLESWQRRRDGEKRLLAWWCRSLVDATGNVTGALSTARDITERKKAEEALRESEARFRTVFVGAPIGIALADSDCRFIDANETFCRMLGYSKEELLRMSVSDVTHPDERERQTALSEAVAVGGRSGYDAERRYVRKDGTVLWTSVVAGPVRDQEGRFLYGIGMVQDITERKQAQERLQVHQQQLRVLASELSLAEERERRRIAMALHDHTCQNLVLARMKIEELLAAASAGQVEAFHSICGTLSDTIEDVRELMFDLSSPTLYRFGLEAALEELLEDKFGAGQDVEYDFSDDAEPKPLTEDVRVLLFQSVREVLINILKHAGAHKIILDIRRTDGSIRIAVTDDGVGFDMDEVSSLPARHRGFGLFNIKERLDYVGGTFEIDSRLGEGSRFVLVAPLKTEGHDFRKKHDVGPDSARG
jgi:PAS domain S-box-containing protein